MDRCRLPNGGLQYYGHILRMDRYRLPNGGLQYYGHVLRMDRYRLPNGGLHWPRIENGQVEITRCRVVLETERMRKSRNS